MCFGTLTPATAPNTVPTLTTLTHRSSAACPPAMTPLGPTTPCLFPGVNLDHDPQHQPQPQHQHCLNKDHHRSDSHQAGASSEQGTGQDSPDQYTHQKQESVRRESVSLAGVSERASRVRPLRISFAGEVHQDTAAASPGADADMALAHAGSLRGLGVGVKVGGEVAAGASSNPVSPVPPKTPAPPRTSTPYLHQKPRWV